jgi:flagellin
MVFRVKTNALSLTAQRHMTMTNKRVGQGVERLASGLRINAAQDDAAGLQISERLLSQVRGLTQAIRNTNDGVSIAQIAEGALQETADILQRMRELALSSANGTLSTSDRSSNQSELSALQSEVTRIAAKTTYGNTVLLDGSFGGRSIQVGAHARDTVLISTKDARGSALGQNVITADAINAIATASSGAVTNGLSSESDLSITGNMGTSSSISYSANSTAETIAAAVNTETANTGVTATAFTGLKLDGLSAAGTITFTLGNGAQTSSISATVSATTDLSALASAINNVSSTTDITATFDTSNAGEMILESTTGKNIMIQDFANDTGGNQTLDLTLTTAVQAESGSATTLTEGTTVSAVVTGSIDLTSTAEGSISLSNANADFSSTTTSTRTVVAALDVSTQSGGQTALEVINSAIDQVSMQRGAIGAHINRLNSAISGNSMVSEHATLARSRIMDADYAKESAELTKNQIIQQAGVAMLTQANIIPELVLSLLKNSLHQ